MTRIESTQTNSGGSETLCTYAIVCNKCAISTIKLTGNTTLREEQTNRKAERKINTKDKKGRKRQREERHK